MERGFVAGGGSGDGFPHPSSRGQALRGGTGMGPRIRRGHGGTRGDGDGRLGDGDGSPHPEDNGWGRGFPHPSGFMGAGSARKQRRRGWGWVPAYASSTGRGAEMTGGAGGPQDNGEGGSPILTRERGSPTLHGGSSRWEDTGGCTPILFPPEGGRERRGWGMAVEVGEGWVPASVFTGGQASPRGQRMGAPR